jgi:hypothetical protein
VVAAIAEQFHDNQGLNLSSSSMGFFRMFENWFVTAVDPFKPGKKLCQYTALI